MFSRKQISTTDFPPWNQIESPYHNISNCPRGWMNKWQQQNQCQSRNDPTKCNFWNQLGDPILKRKLIWIREHLLDEVCQMSDFAFHNFVSMFRVVTKNVEDNFRCKHCSSEMMNFELTQNWFHVNQSFHFISKSYEVWTAAYFSSSSNSRSGKTECLFWWWWGFLCASR